MVNLSKFTSNKKILSKLFVAKFCPIFILFQFYLNFEVKCILIYVLLVNYISSYFI